MGRSATGKKNSKYCRKREAVLCLYDIDISEQITRDEHTLRTYRRTWNGRVIFMEEVKINFTLEQASKAQRGSKGITILFL